MKRIILMVLLFVSGSVFAQEFRATLTGRVTDPSGAVIPNVAVVVTNTDTGAQVKVKSSGTGEYAVPFLLPGPYKVTASGSGFRSYEHTGIVLQTSQKVQEDIQLTLGAANENVVVTAATPLVDATTATVGQVLTAEEIEDLPDNGRSPLGLAKTELGVIPKAKNSVSQTRPFDNSATSDFSIGGGNSQSNEYLLNGVPNNQDSSRVPGFSPNLDSVDAIRTDVFGSDASYGDTSGGTINITTKGGTNQFHGTLSEFNQFSAINAPQRWFIPAGTKTPATRQNQYGATLGGPVWIPKVFNGRDKMFFFYSYERFKDTVPNAFTTTVPTVAERGGDFSALLGLGSSYQIYDPTSGKLSGTTVTRTAVPGNKLQQSQISPIALAYLKLVPLPNLPGATDGENNYFSNIPTMDDYNSHQGRFDYSINNNNKLYFETHRSEYHRLTSNVFNSIATGTATYNVYSGGLVDYIHTFSPTSTLDTRASLTRAYSNTTLPSQGIDTTTLGFPSYIAANATESVLPRMTFSEAKGLTAIAGQSGTSGSNSGSLSTTAGTVSAFDTFQIYAAWTKVIGHQTIKIGPDLRLEKYAKLTPGNPTGAFTFDNTFVRASSSAAAIPFGGSIASFMFGIPTQGTQTKATPAMYNAAYFAGFIQDDWRVLPSLTLNLGLRVEHETPITESHNYAVVGFDPTAANSATVGAIAAYAASYSAAAIPELPVSSFSPRGGLLYASDSHRSEYNTAPLYVSPRFGFAFSPAALHGKTVFRGGYGIFVNPFNDYNTPQSYGFTATTTYNYSTNTPVVPLTTLSDPFPAAVVPIQQPTGSSLGVNTNLGAGIVVRGPDLKVPYNERWSFDIQQQITPSLMVDIGYLGAHQVHLSYSNAISSTPLVPLLSRNRRADPNVTFNKTTNPCGVTPTQNLSCTLTNPFKGLPNMTGTYATGSTITKAALLQAYPEYSAVTQQLVPGSSSTYNELMARLYARAHNGLTFNLNYEYSRNLIASQMNPGETRLVYQESTSDYPHHLSFAGSYLLPLGKGHRLLNNGRVVNALVGGFQASAIYHLLSGTPISWGNVDFANNTNGYNQNFQFHPRDIGHAFNTQAFYTGTGSGYTNCTAAKPTGPCDPTDTGQPNSNNYRTFPQFFGRSDFTNNLDASVLKNFSVGERVKIQYRFEAFNVLNHTQFAAPSVGPTSSTFGTITGISSVNRTLQQGLRVQF
jgi:hypothetical protein